MAKPPLFWQQSVKIYRKGADPIMKFVLDKKEWNRLVKNFPNWDIYYLYEYVHSLELHGDGIPLLLYWKDSQMELCYVTMLQDIAAFQGFHGTLECGRLFDMTTPYGYGGPLCKGKVSKESLYQFVKELTAECKSRNIISQFFRFDPFVEEQHAFFDIFEAKSFKNTVYMDLRSEDIIFQNMDPKNRNMVRKARKNDVQIFSDKGAHLDKFIQIYHATMQRNQAEGYYYFNQEYFEYLQREFPDNIIYFYAVYGQEIISAAMFFYNEHFMHYHLSGTLWEYRRLASVNLLIYEAALWGSRQGIQKLHLGGGMDKDDSLYGFKKQFNRNGILPFTIGRSIFNHDMFQELVKKRAKADAAFDAQRPFLIQYRG